MGSGVVEGRFFSFSSLVSVPLADVVTSHDSASPIGRTSFSKSGASMEHRGKGGTGGDVEKCAWYGDTWSGLNTMEMVLLPLWGGGKETHDCHVLC